MGSLLSASSEDSVIEDATTNEDVVAVDAFTDGLSKCDACKEPLIGHCVFVDGKQMHRSCFRCSTCRVGGQLIIP